MVLVSIRVCVHSWHTVTSVWEPCIATSASGQKPPQPCRRRWISTGRWRWQSGSRRPKRPCPNWCELGHVPRRGQRRICRNFHLRRFEVCSPSVSNGAKRGGETMAVSFKGAHFPKEIILMGVRWYVAYPLSTRHVEELMQERGVSVDHSTINR